MIFHYVIATNVLWGLMQLLTFVFGTILDALGCLETFCMVLADMTQDLCSSKWLPQNISEIAGYQHMDSWIKFFIPGTLRQENELPPCLLLFSCYRCWQKMDGDGLPCFSCQPADCSLWHLACILPFLAIPLGTTSSTSHDVAQIVVVLFLFM